MCGQLAERQISLVPVIFKGSGWYVNDYGKKKSTLGNGDTPATSSDDGHGHSHDDHSHTHSHDDHSHSHDHGTAPAGAPSESSGSDS